MRRWLLVVLFFSLCSPGFLFASSFSGGAGSGGGGDALTTNPLSQFASTTSAQLAGVLSNETGSGLAVFQTSPTLVTPVLGVATGISLALSGTADDTLSVGVGTGGATFAISSNAYLTAYLATYATDTNPVDFRFKKARGTYASPTTVANGDAIGQFVFSARGSTAFQAGAGIRGFVDAAPSGDTVPMGFAFYGGSSFTEYMRITSSGLITFQGITSSFPALRRNGTTLDVLLADSSDYAPLSAGLITPKAAVTVTAGGVCYMVMGNGGAQICYGSGAPSVSAPKGSFYLRSDGSGVADRAYININGTTTWTAVATAG